MIITINKKTLISCLVISHITLFLTNAATAHVPDIPLAKKEILLDNADVEVIRATYPVGSESGFHTHKYANRVVYFVKGGKLALISKETINDKPKQAKIINVADGQILYLPAVTHNVRNIGDSEVIIVETEIK